MDELKGVEQRIQEKAQKEFRENLKKNGRQFKNIINRLTKEGGGLREECLLEVDGFIDKIYEKLINRFMQRSIDEFVGFSEDDKDEDDEDEDDEDEDDEDLEDLE
ncbi:MAG: hypothetical protein GWN31_02140 [Candidatus Thorarchaeota archaeon]|nr:hypothetical protein [Candidatus Thorarchaeota archaeon]NIW12740.1 hypothetical protein [Candidatus Thorarchaeota archaeon]